MNAVADMPTSRLWAAYFGEIGFEFVKALRTPQFAVPTLFFPLMFYVIFALLIRSGNGTGSLAHFAVFGCMGPGLFGFGVSLAMERELGLMTLKQALPSPAGAYLIARAVMAMLFVSIIMLALIGMAVFLAHVQLSFVQGIKLYLAGVLGTLPFCAIGMYVGSLVSGQAAVAICNIIFLPMSFLSGLWFPIETLGKFLADIEPVWPAYHVSQLAMAAVDAPHDGTTSTHVLALAIVTVLFFILAMRRLQNGGFRLLGARPKRALVGIICVAAVAIALSVAGQFVDKKDTAAGESTTPPEPPAGVPAPSIASVADFDGGSATASYGIGFNAVGDDRRGGDSTATQRVVDGGASGSKHALEVAGTIGNKIPYPFAGTMFFPEGPPMKGLMDISGKKTLSFMARGDGQSYRLMIFSGPVADAIPIMYEFQTGSEWKEVRFDLANFPNADFKRLRAIGIGSMGPAAAFRFQIDNVRIE